MGKTKKNISYSPRLTVYNSLEILMTDGNWNEMDSQRFQGLDALLIIFHINSN